MKMTITVDNLTTDKAISLLSALETAEALKNSELDVNVFPTSLVDEEEAQHLADTLSQTWTEETPQGPVVSANSSVVESTPAPAPVESVPNWDDVALSDALADVPTVRKPRQRRTVAALPLIGALRQTRMVPLPAAADMLGWSSPRLSYLIDSGEIQDFVVPSKGKVNFHYLSPEQVAVLKIADELLTRRGTKRLSNRTLRQAYQEWLRRQMPRVLPQTAHPAQHPAARQVAHSISA